MISLLCPTRKRPAGVQRLIQSVCRTADGPVELVLYVDDDDISYEPDVLEIPLERPDVKVRVVTGPRIMMSDMWNKCAEQASYDIFGLCADDIEFRSDGWDTIITEAINKYEDKLAVVYGRDGVHPPPNCATHMFVSRRWTEILGYFTPPYFSGDYPDKWLYDVAATIGRAEYLSDVYIEHHHPIAGKAQWDATYREKQQRAINDDVGQIYTDKEAERQHDADLLMKAMM